MFTFFIVTFIVYSILITTADARKCYKETIFPGPDNGYPGFLKNYSDVKDMTEFTIVPLWPNGIIPYTWDVDKNDEARLREAFDYAVNEYHTHTCIRFVPRTDQAQYMHVHTSEINDADLGMQPGITKLSILCDENDRYLKYKYLHDIGHVVGLDHEQQRMDRDSYVTVHKENAFRGLEYCYIRKNLNTYILNYDYNSYMQYPDYSFTKQSGLKVMFSNDPKFQTKMGQIVGFSKCDIVKINTLYNCTGYSRDPAICTGDTFPDGCLDVGTDCDQAMAGNLCDNYPGRYKLRHCMKTCQNCDKQCYDSKDPGIFAQQCSTINGECTDLQKDACPKSCNVCDDYMIY